SYSKMASTATKSADALVQATTTGLKGISTAGKSSLEQLRATVTQAFAQISRTFSSSWSSIRALTVSGLAQIVAATRSSLSNMLGAVMSGMNMVRSAFQSGTASSVAAVRGYYGSFLSAGSYLGQGLLNGIAYQAGVVISIGRNLANRADAAARSAMKIKSPSRVMMEIG